MEKGEEAFRDFYFICKLASNGYSDYPSTLSY